MPETQPQPKQDLKTLHVTQAPNKNSKTATSSSPSNGSPLLLNSLFLLIPSIQQKAICVIYGWSLRAKPAKPRAHNRAPNTRENAPNVLKFAQKCTKWHKSAPAQNRLFSPKIDPPNAPPITLDPTR